MDQDSAIRKFRGFVEAEGETLGRLLSWAQQQVLEDTRGRLEAQGHSLTLAQIALMQQLCLGSSRQSELARRMGLTKQAVGQIADGLERKGLVRRTPDPNDSRAKTIVYTPRGFAVVNQLIDATLDTERTIARNIGAKDLATLKAILARISEPTGPSTSRR